jgi:hypothetical protein
MKQMNIVRSACVALVLSAWVGINAASAQDIWVLPSPGDAWVGSAQVGSAASPDLIPLQYQGQIMMVSQDAVSAFLAKGARLGYPNVICPMMLDGKPVAAPIWQVPEMIRKGAQVSEDLVVMHKGNEQIAVLKAQVAEYTSKGYELGPRPHWNEGVVMCVKNQTAVVARDAVEKYKKEGATLGPCPKK